MLVATLNFDVIGVIACLVSACLRMSLGSVHARAIHYNVSRTGRMVVGGFSAFLDLVITSTKKPFHIQIDDRTAEDSECGGGSMPSEKIPSLR